MEKPNSDFCNPLRIVMKKDGSIRLCLDARFINACILSDNECPPRMEEILQKFEGKKFFSTTDLVMGYWQIPLERKSRKYTAFLHEGHLYQFTRIPFGLKTAGSGFIRALYLALGQELEEVISCYIDDILIASKTFEEHIEHLSCLFEKLIASGFTLSLKKSLFFREEVSFLGFQLSAAGIHADPSRLSVIADFPTPCDKKQLQAFLGVCGYYRRFSVKHADFVAPFRDILSSKTSWRWTEVHAVAFQEMKDNFLRAVTLTHYLPNKPFHLQTDASDMGLSGILYQIDDDNQIRIISLTSRVLTDVETRYTTSEKELLAIIYSFIKFRMYLIGWKFEVQTDHQALTFLLSTPYQNSRLMRWTLFMQEYEFNISHCRGSDNLVADFFSRNFGNNVIAKNDSDYLICKLVRIDLEKRAMMQLMESRDTPVIEINSELLGEFRNLRASQWNDSDIRKLIESSSEKFKVQEILGIFYYQNTHDARVKIMVPRSVVPLVLKSVHEQFGHAGSYKIFRYVERYFFWKYMRRDVKSFTRSCDTCQRTKHLNYKMEGDLQFITSSEPNDLVAVDFYGPLPASVAGVTYIFVVQDVFSKLVTLYPIRRANTKICLSKLKDRYFPKMGKPKRVLSDHGSQFTSPIWKAELEAVGIKVIFSSIRHPQSNPVERTMRELGRFFRTYCAQKHTAWSKYVPLIQNCLNIMSHQSTGAVPYELHFGKSPRDKLIELFPILRDTMSRREVQLQLAQENMQKAFNRRAASRKSCRTVDLKVGELVLLRVPHLSDASQRVTQKFFYLFEGPYRIVRILNRNAFVLVDPDENGRVKGTYNRVHLRQYHQSVV